MKHIQSIALFFAAIIFIGGCNRQPQIYKLYDVAGTTMGTTYSIKVVQTLPGDEFQYYRLKPSIDSILAEINMQMSNWDPNSEISKFNKSESTEWFSISNEFANVLKESFYISEMTNGAFDVTVSPLIELWGFGPGITDYDIPSTGEIEESKKLTGYEKLSVKLSPPAVRKSIPDAQINLSAIAKGFGVDKISDYLVSIGLNNHIVEIGGEVRARGTKNNEPWKMGVAAPDRSGELQKIIVIENLGVATSGDYRNYFEKNGKRYSHTINPRTGRPIEHTLASVTVLNENCMTADGLATALNVMGPSDGYHFAKENGLAVYMIIRADDKFVEKSTPEFDKYIKMMKN